MPSRCPPSASAARSTARATWSSSRTSQRKLWIPLSSPSVTLRASPATSAPAAIAWSAMASPMPVLEPVTRIRRPLRSGESAMRFLLRDAGFEALQVLRCALGDQHPAAEHANPLAVLVVGPGLDQDRPPVGLRLRRGHLEDRRLGVDGVAVEGRVFVFEPVDLEVGDRLPRDVGHAHAERQRVNQVADHHVLPELGPFRRVGGVEVERVMVHRDQAEEVVVVLGDRLPRPVPVGRADLELLQVAAERTVDLPLAHRLATLSSARPMTRRARTSSAPSKMARTRASTKY